MNRYWIAFAKSGVPSAAGQPAWPRYDAKTDLIMDFTTHGPIAGPDPAKARLDLAQTVSEAAVTAHWGARVAALAAAR